MIRPGVYIKEIDLTEMRSVHFDDIENKIEEYFERLYSYLLEYTRVFRKLPDLYKILETSVKTFFDNKVLFEYSFLWETCCHKITLYYYNDNLDRMRYNKIIPDNIFNYPSYNNYQDRDNYYYNDQKADNFLNQKPIKTKKVKVNLPDYLFKM